MGLFLMLALILVACGGGGGDGRNEEDCNQIAEDIRKAASARGLPAQGICNNKNPEVQKDFKQACDALRECNDR
ncbi:MAG: hypothetical protein KF850_41285 [Labilithrix sp.]|nr:hypothetical protein [Labilithrix sp.]